MKELILPLTYEDINSYFKDNERDAKMMEFVSPLNDTEKEIALIVKNINTSGKLAFILGHPGIGKSTFLHTLNWRTHLQIRNVIDVNSSDFIDENFDNLFSYLNKICTQEVQKKDAGVTALIINYLEYIDEFSEESVKSFFRKLNGLLRNTPILILWPVVSRGDVNKMIEYSKQVSGTLYQRDRAIIEINGPNKEDYVDIAKRTIKVLNNGSELSDFGLTHDDLLETYNNFLELPSVEQNLREFYSRITSKWENILFKG